MAPQYRTPAYRVAGLVVAIILAYAALKIPEKTNYGLLTVALAGLGLTIGWPHWRVRVAASLTALGGIVSAILGPFGLLLWVAGALAVAFGFQRDGKVTIGGIGILVVAIFIGLGHLAYL